jgi:putative transposase
MTAYKYRLKPSAKVIAIFESWLALLRELYNAAFQERRDTYRINHLSINYNAQANQLPEIKQDRPELALIHSQVIQNALKRIEFAFDNFFRRVKEGHKPGYPRFRSSSRYDSFTYPQSGFSLEGRKLRLSKIGKVKVHLSRPIEGEIKACTIKREADGWYVSFAVEEPKKGLAPAPKESVGVDYTSQDCSRCGHRNSITLATRIYRCSKCWLVIHRDRNGAKRIEQKGRAAP